MKFVLTDKHIYWWPVEVKLPHAEIPGKIVTQSFTMQFEAIGADEANAIWAEIEALPVAERAARRHDELVRVSKDWRDVTGEDGSEVPFTEQALRAALQFSWFRVGLTEAYSRSLSADAARKGN